MLTALLALLATAGTGCPEGTTLEQLEREVRCLDADGKPHGPYSRVYPDGSTAARGQYVHGKMTGVWERFHPNGQLASRVEYVDDLPHGEYRFFREDGTPGASVRYDHGERIVDDAKQTAPPELTDLPRNVDLSGDAWLFPVQTNVSVTHLLTDSYRNYLSAAVLYAHGKLTFNRSGTGAATFWGVGVEAETALYSWSPCQKRCVAWAVGPSFRIGRATAFLPSETLSLPHTVLSDVFVYAQLTPRYVSLEGPTTPLVPLSNFQVGGKPELGATGGGWTFRLLGPGQIVTAAMRVISMLLGLVNQSPLFIGASLSNHLSIWGELLVPEKLDRLNAAVGISFGVGI